MRELKDRIAIFMRESAKYFAMGQFTIEHTRNVYVHTNTYSHFKLSFIVPGFSILSLL